ncbi:MAG TPA: ABC-type transport auxiliary lipoprotein family protein [Steroidobacteraceae bacterium]|jgi:ABC-type uncharacterized transport system auxiliary subunit
MRRLGLALLPLALSLAGCAGLLHSTQPALQLYVLQAGVTPPVPSDTVSAGPTLRVARPLAAPGLNTDRIALLRPGSRLDYYAGSRWSAPLAEVVSAMQLSVFRADPAWRAVADERSSFNTDYVLQTSIDRFAAEYAADAGPPLIRVTLQCVLIRRSDGALLGSFTVARSQPALENRMASVIAAFSAAADQAAVAAATQTDALLRSAKPPATP